MKREVWGSARMTDRGEVEVSVVLPLSREASATGPPKEVVEVAEPGRATHAVGFESVNWFGVVYTFTPKQRQVVAALWQAWDERYRWMDQASLMEVAESEQRKLRDLFDQGRHPAWGTMIVQAQLHGGPTGSYGLNPPAGR